MVGQGIFALALDYEDLVHHDQLRDDPTLAPMADKLSARRKDCASLAGKSHLIVFALSKARTTFPRLAIDAGERQGLAVLGNSQSK
jgi:hypothetical protein